ncbi:MAG: hypothetical protein ABEH38_06785 [Flavobacteriales bacterium]
MDRLERTIRSIRRKGAPLAYRWEKLRRRIRGPRKDPWEGIKPIFIVSTGRTATKFFAKCFEERFADVYAVHEPPLDIFPVAVGYFRGEIPFEEARFLFDHYRKGILKEMDKKGSSIYVESNPRLAFMLPVIRSLSDDLRIVHIVRDCRSYVRSGYSKSTEVSGKKVKVRSDEDPRKRITAKDFPDDPYFSKWEGMSRFKRNCWFWQKKDRLIQKELEGEERAKRFFYEDLFEKGKEEIEASWEDLIGFLELEDRNKGEEPFHEYLKKNIENKNAYYELGDWSSWSEEQRNTLLRIAGEHMKELGYDV